MSKLPAMHPLFYSSLRRGFFCGVLRLRRRMAFHPSLDRVNSPKYPLKDLGLYWAKDPKIASQTINARADKAPSFRGAFAKRRSLIPADGFYEWRKTQKPKLPFAIAMEDGRPFNFASAPEKTGKIPNLGNWLRTCTIITGEPNPARPRRSIPGYR
jgi:SOS response associated peptidase (SRAP)